MKSFHHGADRKCGIFLSVAECCGKESVNEKKEEKKKACTRRQTSELASLKKWGLSVRWAQKYERCLEYINNRLALTFIKSFLNFMKKDDGETYNSPNYGYSSILPLPLFSPSLITLTKTHKSAHLCNTMHWGIPPNYPNTSQIQISLDIPVSPPPQIHSSGVRK